MTIIGYIVRNRITGKAKPYATGRAAAKAMDKTDNAYGAVITTRVPVWADMPELVAEYRDKKGK